jgi:small subunit ribosomal protein S4e
MASKGEPKTMKRLNAPRTAKVLRKTSTYLVRTHAGPHAKQASVPLIIILRDMLGFAKTKHETKVILNENKLFVDGVIAKDIHRPVGFMDVISLPSVDKFYRVVYDRKGRIALVEIDRKSSSFKLSKVTSKAKVAKGRTQINLHDGRNILVDKDAYGIGDVLKLSIPDQKVLDSFPLKEGSIAYVTGGKHAGETGTVKDIVDGTMVRAPLAVLQGKDKEFQTRKEYVFVLGVKEPAIKL